MGHVKTKPWWMPAARIVGSWVLAIVILIGGLYAVQSHGGILGSAPIAGGGAGYWVKVTDIDIPGPAYVNLAASSSIIRGFRDDKEATLIWSGGMATAAKEMPEEILKLPQIKTK